MLKLGASLLAATLALWTMASTTFAQALVLDPNLPVYRPVANNLQGELKFAGSNTMSHVASVWASGFRRFYPDVKISINITGSREAVSSVANGQAHIGLLSRNIAAEEVADFEKKLHHPPQVLTPCLERMAIYVHKENPLKGLTLQQIDAVFGTEAKRGAEKPIRTWGQLGFPGAWATQPVVAQGRRDDTGSQVFFQDSVLLGGAYRDDLQSHPDNLELLNAIVNDPRSIGFAGLCYDNPKVRAVAIAVGPDGPFVDIDSPEADAGMYPLVRPLQLVVNHDPGKALPPTEAEFIKYVFSRLGQEDVIKSGFQAIPSRPANIALDAVGLGIAR
ncbi:MAG: PstS family phosphate ABC transporter substrate-binding protein [Planctomycetaceae bacterium]|nr:PstS family phosphate ABC transporter substrate-binding protein [Planctomycetaceae bacterium]